MSKAAVDAGHDRFMQALEGSDVDGLMEVLTDDVTFYPPGEEPARGKTAVRAWYAGAVAQATTAAVDIHTRNVTVSGDIGVEEGTYTWDLQPRDGGEIISLQGSFIAIWRAMPDGAWKCCADIWTTVGG